MKSLLILLLSLAPLPALALSCLKPSVPRSFKEYDAAEETYVVVHGRLTLDESLLPQGDLDQEPPQMTEIPGRLEGMSLTEAGAFDLPFEQAVTLEVTCYGPWCGDAETGTDILAFLRKDESGYALDLNPCGGAAFPAPHGDLLEEVKNCMTGGSCEVDD